MGEALAEGSTSALTTDFMVGAGVGSGDDYG